MSAVVGIDLGTTNSVVAIAGERGPVVLPDEHGEKLVPSIVSFHPNGSVLVGTKARDRRIIDATNTVYSVKRLIGRPFASEEVGKAKERFPFQLAPGATGGVEVVCRGQRHSLPEISAFVLREVRRIAEASLGTTVAQAVVTVPANFNELQRAATKTAGKIAGIEVLRTLNEPTAAALAYGMDRLPRERLAVFDLGGGTFDVTLLELAGDVFEVIATAGDTFLGGDDVDRMLAESFASEFLAQHRYDPRSDPTSFERLRVAAEWAKCQLSYQEMVDVTVEELAYGPGGRPLDLQVRLDRARFEGMVRPIVERAFRVCDEALRVAGLAPTQVDTVILVGGSTRMPIVRRLVAGYFDREPLTDLDPDLVVAQGAAIHAAALVAPLGRAFGAVPAGLEAETLPSVEVEELPGLPPASSAPPVPAVARWKSSTVPPPPGGELPVAPLLVDVTPLSLRVETVGGYSEVVIPRNAPVPLEETRIFTTAQDFQESVRVRVCQGESRRLEENEVLGELELVGLRRANRGQVHVQVTFVLEVDGSLSVHARDAETGMEQRIRIRLLGAVDDGSIEELRRRQDAVFGRAS
ncbi:MAG: Hsp70 family protein [Polyangiales bacterium]